MPSPRTPLYAVSPTCVTTVPVKAQTCPAAPEASQGPPSTGAELPPRPAVATTSPLPVSLTVSFSIPQRESGSMGLLSLTSLTEQNALEAPWT